MNKRTLLILLYGLLYCSSAWSKYHSFSNDVIIESVKVSENQYTSDKLLIETVITSKKNSLISFKQGVIELIIDQRNPNANHIVMSHLDSYFLIARIALNELNTSLSYKMNDNIRIFISLDDPQKKTNIPAQNSHPPKERQNLISVSNPLISTIYYSIFLGDMKRQIRYSIAQQYLLEYLGGILMREKLNPSSIKPPTWLLTGFCNYFSKAVTFKEFEQFSYLARKGAFQNINFIESVNEELFGTIVWYLFEKEKGRSINGAFWLLLKNANSFESTFYFHFEERFGVWLKNRITEIESMGFHEGRNSDFQIPINRIAISDISVNNRLDTVFIQHRNPNKRKSQRIYINSYRNTDDSVMLSTEQLNLDPPVISAFLNSGNAYLNLYETLKLNILNSKIILTKFLDSTQLFTVIESLICETDTTRVLGIIIHLQHDRIQKLPVKLDTLFDLNFSKEDIDFSDFLLESKQHFSVIRSKGNHSEILHFKLDIGSKKWQAFATSTKGYFYHQLPIPESHEYLEFYFLNNAIHFNVLNKNSDLLRSDTLLKVRYSFDALPFNLLDSNRLNFDSSKLFISQFEFNRFKKGLSKRNRKLSIPSYPTRVEPFRNWNFTESSNYYFSNQELDLFYNSSIPVEKLYNSPVTLFYQGSFQNLLKTSDLRFMAFSNINRRRIGFKIDHSFQGKKWLLNQQLDYRIRQFSLSSINYIRNRSVKYELKIAQDLLIRKSEIWENTFHIKLKNHLDQIIPLNLNERYVDLNMRDLWMQTINLNWTSRMKHHWGRLNTNLFFDLNWENGYTFKSSTSEFGVLSAFESKFRSSIYWGILNFETRLNSRYSLTDYNIFYWLMGNNGWIETNQFDSKSAYVTSFTEPYNFQGVGGFVRAIPSASRGGTSYFNLQSDLSIPISGLIPSYSINGPFLKSIRFFFWGDVGLAFVRGNPFHYQNPYNTLVVNTPNYTLTASANRNPWLSSYGIGVKFNAFNMIIRMEYGRGLVGNTPSNQQFSISMGNIF